MSILAEQKKKRKADDDKDGNENWMKGTTKAKQAYMIRETGADEDDTVNMNKFSAKRLRGLKGSEAQRQGLVRRQGLVIQSQVEHSNDSISTMDSDAEGSASQSKQMLSRKRSGTTIRGSTGVNSR